MKQNTKDIKLFLQNILTETEMVRDFKEWKPLKKIMRSIRDFYFFDKYIGKKGGAFKREGLCKDYPIEYIKNAPSRPRTINRM